MTVKTGALESTRWRLVCEDCGLSVLEFIFIVGVNPKEPHEEKVMSLSVTFVMSDRWRWLGFSWWIYPNAEMSQTSREI